MTDLFVGSQQPNIPVAVLPAGIHPPAGFGIVFEAWMDSQASAICRGEWEGWPCQESFDLLREAVRFVGADEGALWLVDDLKRQLRPCFSTGSRLEIFLKEIRQPLSAGLISMVFFTENSICESDVGARKEYSPLVDLQLGAETRAMIAIPVFLPKGAAVYFRPFFLIRRMKKRSRIPSAKSTLTRFPGQQPSGVN
jgi:hypothetical protein